MNKLVVQLFSKLFEAREIAHIFHLQVKAKMGSEAEHNALNEFYEGILPYIDTLIEVYQGQYDIVEGYETINADVTRKKEPIGYLQDFTKFISENRYKAISKEDSHLHNILDEIVALTYKTLYKLKNLK